MMTYPKMKKRKPRLAFAPYEVDYVEAHRMKKPIVDMARESGIATKRLRNYLRRKELAHIGMRRKPVAAPKYSSRTLSLFEVDHHSCWITGGPAAKPKQ